MKFILVVLFLGFGWFSNAQVVEREGKKYVVKKDKILLDGNDVTATFSVEEQAKIKAEFSKLAEEIKLKKKEEERLEKAEKERKKAEKAQNKAEKEQKKAEKALKQKEKSLSDLLKDEADDVALEFTSNGEFDAQLKFAGDTLLFHMHSNVFDFPPDHQVSKSKYASEDKLRSFCGVINIYNFLSDSLKYNRLNDEGFLIGRIFINKENNEFYAPFVILLIELY